MQIVLISIIIGVLPFLLAQLPFLNLSIGIQTAISKVFYFLHGLDWILPVSTIGTLLSLSLLFYLLTFSWRFIKWFIEIIRG